DVDVRGIDEARVANAFLDPAIREDGAVAYQRDLLRMPRRLPREGEAGPEPPPEKRRHAERDPLARPGAAEEVAWTQRGRSRQLRRPARLVEDARRHDDDPGVREGELDPLDHAVGRPGAVEYQGGQA